MENTTLTEKELSEIPSHLREKVQQMQGKGSATRDGLIYAICWFREQSTATQVGLGFLAGMALVDALRRR